mgnify:CR=1 FL=1
MKVRAKLTCGHWTPILDTAHHPNPPPHWHCEKCGGKGSGMKTGIVRWRQLKASAPAHTEVSARRTAKQTLRSQAEALRAATQAPNLTKGRRSPSNRKQSK